MEKVSVLEAICSGEIPEDLELGDIIEKRNFEDLSHEDDEKVEYIEKVGKVTTLVTYMLESGNYLHVAVYQENIEAIKYFLSLGADPDKGESRYNVHTDKIYHQDQGGNKNTKNSYGYHTPRELAEKLNLDEITQLFSTTDNALGM